MITAKVTCNLKQEFANFATVGFCPDYTDGRNKEWSDATPYLDLRMTVKSEVARLFEPGKHYTLQFVEEGR